MAELTPRFETERTRRFRTTDIDKLEERTLSQIEEFGCSIFHITGGTKRDRPLFSYTVGLYDTCGMPEIVTTGLKEETAQFLLNEAANRMRDGENLLVGRHRNLVGEVDCEFKSVAPKWIEHILGWGKWFYEGAGFPVVQAIYPDHENRYPGEDGFNEYFAQPLLQPDTPMTRTEIDFWAANDPESSLFDWKFQDPPHTMVFLSATVHAGDEEITYVSHDIEDGAWQFLGNSMANGGGPVLSCFHHPIDEDPTLNELADLPLGWYAERAAPDTPWVRHEKQPDENESNA